MSKLSSRKMGGGRPLYGDEKYPPGDFRSRECIKFLKQADIVITNPPFSLFREYVAQLFKYNKKFSIIGNQNAITYKEIFPKIKNNKMWLGPTMNGSNRWFAVPDNYPVRENAAGFKIENGQKMLFVNSVIWFTNLDHGRRHQPLQLMSMAYNIKFNKKLKQAFGKDATTYPRYDNYDGIEVPFVDAIPNDYDGAMGVPISFFHKYNPDQFEILELGNSRENFTPNKDYINPKKVKKDGQIVDGGAINQVLAIESVNEPVGTVYYKSDNSKYLIAPYARILIKHKKGQTQ